MFDLGVQAVWPETWGWLIQFRDGKVWEKTNGSSTWHDSSNGTRSGNPGSVADFSTIADILDAAAGTKLWR